MLFEGCEFIEDDEGFISLGQITAALARGEQPIVVQTQYLSFYLGYGKSGDHDHGVGDRPNLAKGLYYIKHPYNYHQDRIHKGNTKTFVERVRRHFARCE